MTLSVLSIHLQAIHCLIDKREHILYVNVCMLHTQDKICTRTLVLFLILAPLIMLPSLRLVNRDL